MDLSNNQIYDDFDKLRDEIKEYSELLLNKDGKFA